jgi:hypothetical protein
MQFFSNLDVPRTSSSTGVPRAWAQDFDSSAEVRVTAMCLLTYLAPGVEMDDSEYDDKKSASDPAIADVVPGLVEAGYLHPQPGDRFELVHPARLGDL